MVDHVVISSLVVASDAGDAGGSHVLDGVVQIPQVVCPLAEETILGDVFAIEGEALEFDIAWAVGEVCGIHVEHCLIGGIGSASPDDVRSSGAVAGERNPGIWVAAVCGGKCAG